jgi:uncharacterized membrane protein
MKLEIFSVLVPTVLEAVLFQFSPLFTRRGIFFSATVDPEFPRSADGRAVLRSYRLQMAVWSALALAMGAVLAPSQPELAALLPVMVLLVLMCLTYWRKFREVHAHYGLHLGEVRESHLSTDESSGFNLWLALPPLLAMAAVAWYLRARWNQIPPQFPVHWGADGHPNGWTERTWSGVYGSLLAAAFMNLSFPALGWLMSRMSRRTNMRAITMRVLQLMLYPLTYAMGAVALLPLVAVPLWTIPVLVLGSVIAVVYWAYRKMIAPVAAGEVPEPQRDSYWKAGLFYYNPEDPAIFVSKRVGIGYTVNFANKVSWLVMAGILLVALLPAFLLSK